MDKVTAGWRTDQVDDDQVQVYPIGDLVDHVTAED